MSVTDAPFDIEPEKKRAKTTFGPARRHPMIGTIITKEFDGAMHSGKVISYDQEAKIFKVHYNGGEEEELDENEFFGHCPRHPDGLVSAGWKIFEVERKGAIKTRGRVDRYWISPGGKRFRSRKEIERYMYQQKTLNGTNVDKEAASSAAEERQGRLGLVPSLAALPSDGLEEEIASTVMVAGNPVAVLGMADPGKVGGRSFLDVFAPGRKITLSFNISHISQARRYTAKPEFTLNGGTYTAVSTRTVDQRNSRSPFGPKKNTAYVTYLLTKGGGRPDFHLQRELEKIADFASLSPPKISARLELFTSSTPSPHPEYIRRISSSCFETIQENGNDGCGFAPSSYIEDLIGNTADAIQVRIFGPKIGIAKGLFVKKPSATKFQLPSSMVKVPPSRTCSDDWVCVVVKDTLPSRKNITIGALLDPDLSGPSASALKDLEKTATLKGMYKKHLRGCGVPASVLDHYSAAIKRSACAIKHAHLTGVADPTGQLPPGQVFISGYVGVSGTRKLFGAAYPKVYLSRSPALVPGDAKLVGVVGKRPPRMTKEKWNYLCSLRFGVVVFAAPEEEMLSLPAQVGEGDLDGDRYLCVFANKILKSLEESKSRAKEELQVRLQPELSSTEKRRGDMSGPANSSCSAPASTRTSWLSDSQKISLDLPAITAVSDLTGKLYGLCDRKIDEHGFMHREVRLLCRAYKDSLDAKKHSLTISLPQKLREELPRSLWQLLEGEDNLPSPHVVHGFDSIISHRMDRKGLYRFRVKWDSGEVTTEPDTFLMEDDPKTFGEYLRSSGLAFKTKRYQDWSRSDDSDSVDGDSSSSEGETEDDSSFVYVTDQFGKVRRVSAYEEARRKRIRRNNEFLKSLGLLISST